MCDCFVALPSATADRSTIFAKNSDREANEAQIVEFHARADHPRDSGVACTYVTIPQVERTAAIVISRPSWMWGAEMGVNEHGVVIGNEAIWTRIKQSRAPALTGMDLVRLALERSSTASAAIDVIISLLALYDQGGSCSREKPSFTYHNSFLIADRLAAWVLETAGHLWCVRRVRDVEAISNRLSIGDDIDRCHPQLIETAKRFGWHSSRKRFNFAKSYRERLYTTFSGSASRREQSLVKLADSGGSMTVADAISMLSSHKHAVYHPDRHLRSTSLCAHGGNSLTRFATQTVNSLIVNVTDSEIECWTTATSTPCLSIFKPIWFGSGSIPDLGPLPGKTFDPNNYWWHHELFHRTILCDYPTRMKEISDEKDKYQAALLTRASMVPPSERESFSETAFQAAQHETDLWLQHVQRLPVIFRPNRVFRSYWKTQNRNAAIHIPDFV